jgi:integrase/recombinase XerD
LNGRGFELRQLATSDVRFDQSQIIIRSGKGKKSRVVPISEGLKSELRSLVGDRNTGALFCSGASGQLSLRQLNRIVAMAGQRAGIANPNPRHRQITCHLFRHTFARLWKQEQGSIETLSRILGHAHASTTWSLYGTESQHDVQRNYEAAIGRMFSEQGDRHQSRNTQNKRKGVKR